MSPFRRYRGANASCLRMFLAIILFFVVSIKTFVENVYWIATYRKSVVKKFIVISTHLTDLIDI